ncbi:hypothetical protein FOXYSP1_09651 [Fusarium oxysporum f. sp. phaseoli]
MLFTVLSKGSFSFSFTCAIDCSCPSCSRVKAALFHPRTLGSKGSL